MDADVAHPMPPATVPTVPATPADTAVAPTATERPDPAAAPQADTTETTPVPVPASATPSDMAAPPPTQEGAALPPILDGAALPTNLDGAALPLWAQSTPAAVPQRAPWSPWRLLAALPAKIRARAGHLAKAPASGRSGASLPSQLPADHPPLDGDTLMVPPPPPPLPGMMALLDQQQRCVAASPGLARWLGTDRDLLVGLSLEQVMGPAAAEVLAPQLDAALAGHLRRLRCCHVGATGAERWLQVELQPQLDEYGERVGCHLLAMDVTPEHRQWQSTQRSERRLRFMLDQVPATVAYVDSDMRFRHVNRHQARWLGVAASDAIGVPVHQLVDASTWAELEPDLATALRGVTLHSHRQLLGDSGESTWQAGEHVPDQHADGRVLGVVSVFVDQPDATVPASQATLAGTAAAAARSSVAECQAGTTAAPHDAELVVDLHADSPLRPWLAARRGPGASVLSVMNDALDLVRLSTGQLQTEQLDFHLVPAVEEVVQLLAPRAHAKQLELACRIDPHLPEGLRGDPQRLHQVLEHLLDNAVKYTLGGEVLLDVQREGPDQLRFAVHDTGIGLCEEQLQRFGPLLAGTGEPPAPGTAGSGLGLAVVRGLVRLMGGQLGVRSSPGEGATFWFSLPLVAAEGLPPLARPAPLPAHHVLVVDDNATTRAILEQHLVAGGQRCSTAASAAEALATLHAAQQAGDPVRVALVDVRMPGTDGIDLATSVRADATLNTTQLVLMTARQSRQDLARARQAGIAAYLCKPVRGQDLYRALAQALSASRGPAAGWALSLAEPLPAAAAAADLPPAAAAQTSREPLPVLHARVLVAEQVQGQASATRDMLKALGCDFEVVANGEATLQALRVEHFDLVLMDCQMPGLDGLAATRAIRQREQDSQTRRRQAVIGLSPAEPARHSGGTGAQHGSPASDLHRSCLAAGMDELLARPFSPRQLAEAMARWLPPELVEHALDSDGDSLLPIPSGPTRLAAVPSARGIGLDDLLDPLVLDRHPGARGHAAGGGADPLARNQVIQDFVNSLPAQLQALRRALLDGQPAALAQTAGQLAMASTSVGAGTLSELCSRLEGLGQAGQLTGAAELVAAAESVIDRLLPVLHAEVRMAA